MRKIFKIAIYDFKRLIFYPITLIGLAVLLVICAIVSATYKIPTTPAYSATVSGETSKEIYENFITGSENEEYDTQASLNALITEANLLITVQTKTNECPEAEEYLRILDDTLSVEADLLKYHYYDLTNPSSTPFDVFCKEVVTKSRTMSTRLKTYISDYEKLEQFETRYIFTKETFKKIKSVSTQLETTLNSQKSHTEILDEMYDNLRKLTSLRRLKGETWGAPTEDLEQFQKDYVTKATTKAGLIEDKMAEIRNTNSIKDMKSLITNYKLTCESALEAVKDELTLLLRGHYKKLDKLYGYENIKQEDVKIALAKASFFIEDKELFYTNYQIPLNFNIASSKVTAYDNAFFIISLIGVAVVAFGIYCAYKLFGRDRRNGKMDVILSQDVTRSQVFAGKFMAIVFSTTLLLVAYTILMLIWSMFFNPMMAGEILAIFNLSSPYTVNPFAFLLIKLIGIELQVIFYAIITIFLMNLSRKFEISFASALLLFAVATICNTFLNGVLVYCLFPFIHADLTSFLGGGKMSAGFLQTALYSYGNFYISLVYYLVVVGLLYNFTNQLFKKN